MAQTINATLTGCPADCNDALNYPALPAASALQCASYDQPRAQICWLYLLPNAMSGDIFSSWGSSSSATPVYVSSSIDNTQTNNSKAKKIGGIGEVPVPEKTVTLYPFGKSRTTDKRYTLNFTVYQLDDATYDFLRELQCGALNFKFYYADRAGFAYGISDGMVPDSISVRFPKGNGNTDKNTAVITVKWRATGDPQRRANPIA